MPIEFVTLPKEQAEEHIRRLLKPSKGEKQLDIVLTDSVSMATMETHEKALQAIGEKTDERVKTIINALVGHVHGRTIEEIGRLLGYTEAQVLEAIENITTWNLSPLQLRAVIRDGVAILAPAEGPVEIPRPPHPTRPPRPARPTRLTRVRQPRRTKPPEQVSPPSAPEIPKKITNIPRLKETFRQLLESHLKPGFSPKDVVELRKKLKAIQVSDFLMGELIKRLLSKTMLLVTKNPPAREYLVRTFVTDINGQIREISKEFALKEFENDFAPPREDGSNEEALDKSDLELLFQNEPPQIDPDSREDF